MILSMFYDNAVEGNNFGAHFYVEFIYKGPLCTRIKGILKEIKIKPMKNMLKVNRKMSHFSMVFFFCSSIYTILLKIIISAYLVTRINLISCLYIGTFHKLLQN